MHGVSNPEDNDVPSTHRQNWNVCGCCG